MLDNSSKILERSCSSRKRPRTSLAAFSSLFCLSCSTRSCISSILRVYRRFYIVFFSYRYWLFVCGLFVLSPSSFLLPRNYLCPSAPLARFLNRSVIRSHRAMCWSYSLLLCLCAQWSSTIYHHTYGTIQRWVMRICCWKHACDSYELCDFGKVSGVASQWKSIVLKVFIMFFSLHLNQSVA